MRIELDTKIYPKSAILSTFSYYSNDVDVLISESDTTISVDIKFLNNNANILNEIHGQLIRTATRHIIAENTKEERELIIGRALYGSCLEEY